VGRAIKDLSFFYLSFYLSFFFLSACRPACPLLSLSKLPDAVEVFGLLSFSVFFSLFEVAEPKLPSKNFAEFQLF
jgi:hypothetical protein